MPINWHDARLVASKELDKFPLRFPHRCVDSTPLESNARDHFNTGEPHYPN